MPGSADQRAMARSLAALFGAGATLVALTVALPHGDHEHAVGLFAPVGLAYIVCAGLVLGGARVPGPLVQVALALGTLLIAVCVLLAGSAGAAYAFMFVWVGGYAAAFFGTRGTAAHVAWAAATYAVALAVGDHVHPAAVQWLMAVGTTAVAAVLIGVLSRLVRARTRDLSAVAALATHFGGAQGITPEQLAIAVCEALSASAGAGAVVMLETLPDRSGLRVLGMAGSAHVAPVLDEPAAVAAADVAFRTREPAPIADAEEGRVRGMVQPIVTQDGVAGLLALVWRRPRRQVSARIAEAAALFAGEAAGALDRLERENRDRHRLALELNDEIVQGLVVAKYALRDGRVLMGEQAIDETLLRARALVTDQLDALHGESVRPGALRRRSVG